MLKHKMTYTDYNGMSRTETFYFNLTKLECLELNLGPSGGLEEYLNRLVEEKDLKALIEEFKKFILAAYGVKSPDGREFIKNDQVRASFAQTEAFSDLFMRMASDAEFAANFIRATIPNVPDDTEESSDNGDLSVISPMA